MFSLFIVCYLFLAGAGGGAYVIAAVFSLCGHFTVRNDLREYRIITQGGFALGPLLVAFGALFLIFDLGSPERALTIFVTPKLSIVNVGSWAVLLFCVLGGATLWLHTTERVRLGRLALRALESLALLAALGVISYTGVLVSSIPAVPLLHTPLVVALFIISSFSAGAAVITLYGFLNQQRKSMHYGLRIIPWIDVAFIALEVVALAALLTLKYLEGGVAQDSVVALVLGEGAPIFWCGVVALGVVVPVMLSFIAHRSHQSSSAATWAVSATALLAGAFALRYCLIMGGLHVAVVLV